MGDRSMPDGPLHGIRVLEFSLILSGPFAGMQLADMGADVIKVEPPSGDPVRNRGPIPGMSKAFQVRNRGRRSLAVDLRMLEGRDVIHRLVLSTDVVIINYRPGSAQRLGVDYETLRAIRPDLIYAEISGYGFEGPMAQFGGTDITASAYGGAVALTDAFEEDGAPRANHPPIAGDIPSGLAAAMGILAALYHRERTGEGQLVRTSLLRAVLAMTSDANGRDPIADPSGRDLIAANLKRAREAGSSYPDLIRARRRAWAPGLYFRGYRAKDGGLVFGANTPAARDAIRRALGLVGTDTDEPGFDPDVPEWLTALKAREQEIVELMETRTVAEWLVRLNAEGAPASPVNFPEEIADDPQAALHFVEVPHPISGSSRMAAPIVDMMASPTRIQRPAPLLGQHSVELLEAAGFSAQEIDYMREIGAVYAGG
jgi:crotonobetainyl-CoA:carnitine CoA-transferase CaiB-like acyl-CoA transferase